MQKLRVKLCDFLKLFVTQKEIKPRISTFQMVWTNHGNEGRANQNHPVHLHGHSYHVVHIGESLWHTKGFKIRVQISNLECYASKQYTYGLEIVKYKDSDVTPILHNSTDFHEAWTKRLLLLFLF